MNLTKSEFVSIRHKFILQLLVITLAMEAISCCGPGRSGGRQRMQGKLKPLVFKQHVPNVPERTLGASGPNEGLIGRSDPRFKDLIPNYNSDIIFKDEEGTGEDRLMTQRCKERLNTLAVSVMNLWPGVRLRVTESWDNEGLHHSDSLHYEGRAVDITTSDRDSSKYGMLARLAVEAGFDWVYYESRSHVHCSVKSESSQAAKSLGCFSGETTVTLANGGRRLMSQLQIGDAVLTLNSGGNLEYSPVVIFMHRSPEQATTFLRMTTESGTNITITPSHLILRWQKPNISSLYEAQPVYAQDVAVNDQLLISGAAHDKLGVERILHIEVIQDRGVYAPLTATGTIVVNDVVASCYAVFYSQRLAHLAFAPIRWYYTMETSFSNFYHLVSQPFVTESPTNANATARYSPQSGIHWYCKLLQSISVLVPSSWMLEA